MTDIVVFGVGKITDVVASLIEEQSGFTIKGFTCDRAFMTSAENQGRPVIPFDEVETVFPPASHRMLVAIGYHDLNRVREERCREASGKGYGLVSWISPDAHVPATCTIGANCVILPGAALQPHARLGDGVFVWHNAVVGHHATIGDYCWLASNCAISSTTTMGERCFVGVNAAIGHQMTVGADSLIGAGAIVTRSTEPGGVYIVGDTPRYRLDGRRFMRIAQMS
ncbi:acetyltransferase [Bosea sp. (in: a-proteobacteria)]|jgi:sugar O-acyltransferase (sialic acid O-acetyltransferase NeuD family)|uniref:acetyltransferase n=1 Tax=Bosea sp. (in: a-proteobacteria) TaxID=1871050 RepID=UPI0035632943